VGDKIIKKTGLKADTHKANTGVNKDLARGGSVLIFFIRISPVTIVTYATMVAKGEQHVEK